MAVQKINRGAPASRFKKDAVPVSGHAAGTGGYPDLPVDGGFPEKKHGGIASLTSGTIIIFGERGIGKSTLADEIFGNDALFEMFETDRTLEVYAKDCRSWPQFCSDVDNFLAGKTPVKYSGMVVDNGAMAYETALEHACQVNGIEHPGGQNDYGQSWAKVRKEFTSPFRRLLASRHGLIVVCHELEKEIETRGGRKFVKMRPDWSKQADDFLSSFMENIFYYYFDGEERWLQIVGDEYVTAKVKFKRNFFTSKGERIHRIPMGTSVKEAYRNLLNAFNNKQTETYSERKEGVTDDEKVSKFKKQ